MRLFELFRYLHYESIISTSLRTLSWDFKGNSSSVAPSNIPIADILYCAYFSMGLFYSCKLQMLYLKSPNSSETREEFALPTFTMCNYQAHSKHKIKDLYPFVRTRFTSNQNLTIRFSLKSKMPIWNLIKVQGWSISFILRLSRTMRSRIVPNLDVGDKFLVDFVCHQQHKMVT